MNKIKQLCLSVFLSLFFVLAGFQACHGIQQRPLICAAFLFGISAAGAVFLHNKTKARKFVFAGQIRSIQRTEQETKKIRFLNFVKWLCIALCAGAAIFAIFQCKKNKIKKNEPIFEPQSPSPAPKHLISRRNSWPIDDSSSPDPRFGLQRPPSMERDFGRSQSLPRNHENPPAMTIHFTTSPESLGNQVRRRYLNNFQ